MSMASNGTDMLAQQYPEVAMIRECLMNGEGCVQVINDLVLMASNGTIDLQLKESDFEKIVELNTLIMDCVMEGERCDQLVGTAIWYTVYIVSNETIILTEEDFERGYLIATCLMGSNATECDQLEEALSSLVMNATEQLAEKYPEVVMIRECLMNGEGCVEVINDVVLIASNGTIDLQLKESDFEKIKELNTLVMDCVMEGERCDQLVGTAIWYTVYIVSNETIILTEEDFERGYLIATCLMGSNATECDQLEEALSSLAMNVTDMLAEQYPEVVMIRQCYMNGEGCVQVINDVVFMASNGTIDLQLTESNFEKIVALNSLVTECVMEGE